MGSDTAVSSVSAITIMTVHPACVYHITSEGYHGVGARRVFVPPACVTGYHITSEGYHGVDTRRVFVTVHRGGLHPPSQGKGGYVLARLLSGALRSY